MMKFIRTPNVLMNPDHVAAVERDRDGKLTVRLAIADAEGHYFLRVEDPGHAIWMQFSNRRALKADD
jgi:hypothetical protein